MFRAIVNTLKFSDKYWRIDNVPRWRNETTWRIKLIMEETLFISNFPCEIKNVFRRIEQIKKKLINCKSSVLFNNDCIKKTNILYTIMNYNTIKYLILEIYNNLKKV